MAAFLQPADPWIENTFVHAITFQDTPTSDETNAQTIDVTSQLQQHEHEESPSEWEQTENTIPSGLLPSPPLHSNYHENNDAPSRQAKIVQIISIQGCGWDGSSTADNAKCPPYVLLHDGVHSTIAFLSKDAQRSIEMNTAETTNNEAQNIRSTRRTAQEAAQRIKKLDAKSLASINYYTVSTVAQCCPLPKHQKSVFDSLDIGKSHYASLKPLRHLFLCIYVTEITVIGAENQGLIGESKDVHCSPRVRQALNGNDDYEELMIRLELCHGYYQREAQKRAVEREGSDDMSSRYYAALDWPWESRLAKDPVETEIQQGDVACLLNGSQELENVLGSLSQFNEEDKMSQSQRFQRGNAEELFNNYEHLEDVLEFTQENGAAATDDGLTNTNNNAVEAATTNVTPSRLLKERAAMQSPGNVVTFAGIDQMIASQSQDSDGELEEQPLTQADTLMNEAVEFQPESQVMGQSEQNATNTDQSSSPEMYFSAEEQEDPTESQIPIRVAKRTLEESRASNKRPDSSSPPMAIRKKPPMVDSNDSSQLNTHSMNRNGVGSDKQKSPPKPRITYPASRGNDASHSQDSDEESAEKPLTQADSILNEDLDSYAKHGNLDEPKNSTNSEQLHQPGNNSSSDEYDEHNESQIPTRASKKSKTNAESQAPIDTIKNPSICNSSSEESDTNDGTNIHHSDSDDSDDWMKVYKIKSKGKAPQKTPFTHPESQGAGEESEESSPILNHCDNAKTNHNLQDEESQNAELANKNDKNQNTLSEREAARAAARETVRREIEEFDLEQFVIRVAKPNVRAAKSNRRR